MNNLKTANTFVFNPAFDVNYLNSLYGDDFVYFQEVLNTVLNDYQSLTDNIDYSFTSGNLTSLRSAVHKIKPVFGFVGLTQVQHLCQEFEQRCTSASAPDQLSGEFESLKNRISQSKQLIEEEKKKLELFNSQSS